MSHHLRHLTRSLPRSLVILRHMRSVSSDVRFISTADICDMQGDNVHYLNTQMRDFGGAKEFAGIIETVDCFEDNSKVKEAVKEDGTGKVLVVDGKGSMFRALLGDMVAKEALSNGWRGVVINGCIRDSVELSGLQFGVKALGTHPRKSLKANQGTRQSAVEFGGCSFVPGKYIYVDADGVVVSDKVL